MGDPIPKPTERDSTRMNSIKRSIALLLLAASLAFPAGAFAAQSSSSTAESLSVAATVSMTAPASATFTLAGGDIIGDSSPDFSVETTVTVIGSNNPSGVTLTATVDPWVQGGITIPTSKRGTYFNGVTPGAVSGGLVAASAPALGAFANSGTVVTLASSTGPLANASIGVGFVVDGDEFTVGGTYTSAVHYTTTTNP